MNNYELFSDGGGTMDSDGGCGTILRNLDSGEEFRISVYLGRSTNNEAEICSGLVGFSLLRALGTFDGTNKSANVRWVSDSEYVLKSATQYIKGWVRNGWQTSQRQPVKNKGLWLAYLALSSDCNIEPEHVRGHSGHLENEACDRASTFARMNGGTRFKSYNNQTIEVAIDCGKQFADKSWYFVDGRPFLQFMRHDNPTTEETFWFEKVFNGITKRNGNGRPTATSIDINTKELNTGDNVKDLESKLLKELAKTRETARSLEPSSTLAKTVRVSLDVLLGAVSS